MCSCSGGGADCPMELYQIGLGSVGGDACFSVNAVL